MGRIAKDVSHIRSTDSDEEALLLKPRWRQAGKRTILHQQGNANSQFIMFFILSQT